MVKLFISLTQSVKLLRLQLGLRSRRLDSLISPLLLVVALSLSEKRFNIAEKPLPLEEIMHSFYRLRIMRLYFRPPLLP